jgi:hypothetical protein
MLTAAGPCSGLAPGCSSDGLCRNNPGMGCPVSALLNPPHTLLPVDHAETVSAGTGQDRGEGPPHWATRLSYLPGHPTWPTCVSTTEALLGPSGLLMGMVYVSTLRWWHLLSPLQGLKVTSEGERSRMRKGLRDSASVLWGLVPGPSLYISHPPPPHCCLPPPSFQEPKTSDVSESSS